MPGRQSTRAPAAWKPKLKKQKAKRSLNALAIAEEQNPERSKIRRSRLGELEPQNDKRKRKDSEEKDPDHEDEGDSGKRRLGGQKDRYGNEIEVGSDSSGNEWVVGQVDGENDSDLDSNGAIGEGDEEIFSAFAFSGSSKAPNPHHRSKTSSENLEEPEDGVYDLREDKVVDSPSEKESDGFGDEAVDLATMLDASDEETDPEKRPKNSRETYVMSKAEGHGHEDWSDGEETGSEKEGSQLSFSENEDDERDSTKLASLQALVSTMSTQDQARYRTRDHVDTQESNVPSEFGLNSKRKLTVADLVPSVTDPHLKKSLKILADSDSKSPGKRGGLPGKLEVPLPKRQQDRIDRAAAYDRSKKTLNRWIDTVKHNRRAEHLSFPLHDPEANIAQGSKRLLPATQSKPLNDLEITIQGILQDSGLAPTNGKTDEDQLQAFEELQTNKMPLQEVQARRAELRRARELLFREEIRAKRIKKIKSKTYRKIHRRERERNAQQLRAELDDSEEDRDRNDRRRAEDRMGARHRESRWAKGVKDSGRAKWDEDARSGVVEMARRGEDLKRRIEGKNMDANDDGDSSLKSNSDGIDEFGDGGEHDQHTLQHRFQDLQHTPDTTDFRTRGSKLHDMDFMKKAEAVRRSENDSDLKLLRRALDREGTPTSEEAEEGQGRQFYGPMQGMLKDSKAPTPNQSEFEERQESDDDVRDGDALEEDEHEILLDSSKSKTKLKSKKPHAHSSKEDAKKPTASQEPFGTSGENPWIAASKKAAKRDVNESIQGSPLDTVVPAVPVRDNLARKGPKTGSRVKEDGALESNVRSSAETKPRSAMKGARAKEKTSQGPQPCSVAIREGTGHRGNEDDDIDKLPFVFRSDDLVRKAFAGDDVVQDFAKEKEETMHDEEDKIIDNTLPGWGNWTGEGISKKAQKRNKGKVLIKQPGIAREKRQDAKLERVIINEKRVKKNAKYLASTLPHPFETRQQYERSLRLPVGPEWTTKETHQAATKPRILMKQGIIAPMLKAIM